MKRKPSYKQIISGALATTFLLESCAKDYDLYYSNQPVNDINKNLPAHLKNGSPYSLLDIQISDDDRQYFDFINKLTLDILNDRNNANKFLANPAEYAAASGFPGLTISLDDDLIKLITAIADEELYNAIQHNDISKFLKLCKEKNLITEYNLADANRLNKLVEANPALLSLMDINNPDSSVVAFAFAVAVGALVAVWVVVVTHAVGVNVVGGATVFVGNWAAVTSWKIWGSDKSSSALINSDPHLMQIWALNGGDASKTFLLLTEYEDTQIKQFMDILGTEFPELLANVDRESLKQLIAMNLKEIAQ
jgi:hypothetical protein